MPIKINGSTSGYTEIKAADTAANNTLTLPSASGTLMTTGGSNTFTSNQIIEVTDNTNAALRITQLGTGAAIRVEDETNPDSTPFVVDASGNVGIGTASPADKLHVSGGTRTTNIRMDQSYPGVALFPTSGTANARAFRLEAGDGNFYILGQNDAGTTTTYPFYIQHSGNVGIGTGSPPQRLTVTNTSITGGGPATSGSAADPNAGMRVVMGGVAFDTGAYTNGTVWLQGRLGSNYASNFDLALNPNGGSVSVGPTSSSGIYAGVTSNAGNWRFGAVAPDVNAGFLRHIAGGVDKVVWYGNGNLYTAAGAYGTISDAKVKENIVDATPKLDDLNKVRIVNYNLIGDEQKQLGVVAQELELIFPGLIENTPDQDVDGNDLGTVTKRVKFSVFVPMLVKAVQELSAKVEAQAAEISDLKTRLTALEGGAA